MATTIAGDNVSAAFEALTANLSASYRDRAYRLAMETLDPQNIDGSQLRYIAYMTELAQSLSTEYTNVSKRYIGVYAAAEGVVVPKMVVDTYAKDLMQEQFKQRMMGAGPFSYKKKLANKGIPMSTTPPAPQNIIFQSTAKNISHDLTKHVLQPGRDTIVAVSTETPYFGGYSRNPNGGACDFCLMLATRDNYRSKSSASFEAHRACGCSPEPITDDDWLPSPDKMEAYSRFLETQDRLNEKAGVETTGQRIQMKRDAKAAKKAAQDKPEGAEKITEKEALSEMLG